MCLYIFPPHRASVQRVFLSGNCARFCQPRLPQSAACWVTPPRVREGYSPRRVCRHNQPNPAFSSPFRIFCFFFNRFLGVELVSSSFLPLLLQHLAPPRTYFLWVSPLSSFFDDHAQHPGRLLPLPRGATLCSAYPRYPREELPPRSCSLVSWG